MLGCEEEGKRFVICLVSVDRRISLPASNKKKESTDKVRGMVGNRDITLLQTLGVEVKNERPTTTYK